MAESLKFYISRTASHTDLVYSSFEPEYILLYMSFIHYICLNLADLVKTDFLLFHRLYMSKASGFGKNRIFIVKMAEITEFHNPENG